MMIQMVTILVTISLELLFVEMAGRIQAAIVQKVKYITECKGNSFIAIVDCHLICDSTGGQCINGSCICNTGWSGDECDNPQCAIGCNPQGGYCTVPNECLCNQNWNGTNCSEPLCAVNCSSIGGICPTADNCTCLQGYTGDSCEIGYSYF